MTFKPDNTQNSFLTTAETFPEDDSQFLIKLTSLYTDIANAVNIREIAQYENAEVLTGQQYFTQGNNQTKRYVFRKVFSIGAIASGATSTVAHGIAGLVLPVHIYGVATTDVVDWRPIPCPDTVGNNFIFVKVDGTNYVIINGAGSPNITGGTLVIEYLKN